MKLSENLKTGDIIIRLLADINTNTSEYYRKLEYSLMSGESFDGVEKTTTYLISDKYYRLHPENSKNSKNFQVFDFQVLGVNDNTAICAMM